ncbi:MAG: hypothetical protein ACP5HC_06495 [Caldisericum sp.]
MNVKDFLKIVSNENIDNIEKIVVETKDWFYSWTKKETQIVQKTQTLSNHSNDVKYRVFWEGR